MWQKAVLAVWIVLLAGCSGYHQQTKRYQLPSDEGRYTFVENIKGQKQDLFDAAFLWVKQLMNKETTDIIEKSRENGLIRLNALAPVTHRGKEEYCQYELQLFIEDNRMTTYFITKRMIDQYYPSINSLKELKTYYKSFNQAIKKALTGKK